MHKTYRILACAIILCALFIPSLQQKAHGQNVTVSYQDFYDQLAPYGQWVADPQYGNVWVPNEEPGYRPYATRGNWVMTDQGNVWVSDVPWGWACYHYGRWTYNNYYGWVWIPGNEWAPSWVNWRSGNGYYGWAPMGPGQYPGSYYEYPVNYWVFVTPQYLYSPNVYGYYEPRYVHRYYRQTTYINETYVVNGSSNSYYYGPRAEIIERETHQPVQVYRVSSSTTPGAANVGGNSVSIYRPAINRGTVNTAHPANVIRATQPIGKPEAIAAESTSGQPAFRQEMQKQNPAFKQPNNYSGNTNVRTTAPRNSNEVPVNIRASQPQEPARNMPQNNANEPQGRPMDNPSINNHFNQPQGTGRAMPQNNAQPVNNNRQQRNQQPKAQQQHSSPPPARQEKK